MSQTEKAAYFQALKTAGVRFDKHYREYSTAELKTAYETLAESQDVPIQFAQDELPLDLDPLPAAAQAEPLPPRKTPPPEDVGPPVDSELDAAAESFFGLHAPKKAADPREMPGQRQNSQPVDEPIRVDEQGRLWFQEEIRKPAFPKARGRRVLTYADTGSKVQTVKNGDFIESFEVAGDEKARISEVKITLPSYQVGIFRDPRFPFRVHVYNGAEGFDLFEVADFYGGAELVPAEVKRVYVENVLCYDIRTVVRAINDEYRQLQLTGKV